MLQNRQPKPMVQKSSSSKAAAILMRGAYSQYLSANVAKSDKSASPKAAKCRRCLASRFGKPSERRWRLFSTFPFIIRVLPRYGADKDCVKRGAGGSGFRKKVVENSEISDSH